MTAVGASCCIEISFPVSVFYFNISCLSLCTAFVAYAITVQPHENYLLCLLAAVIHQVAPPAPAADLDWPALLSLAHKHSITNLVCEAVNHLEPASGPPPEIRNQLQIDFQVQLVKDACQHYEGELIFQQLSGQQITHMPLKGWLIKPLYPRSDLRSMADLDIFYDPSRTEDVRHIMRDLGYREELHNGNHDVYYKDPYICVEMHRSLMPEDSGSFVYFKSMIGRAERQDYQLILNPVDCYIYLLAHLMKHCQSTGTGIRSIMDIYIYRQHYHDQLDSAMIRRELARLGLDPCARHIEALADAWFGKAPFNQTTAQSGAESGPAQSSNYPVSEQPENACVSDPVGPAVQASGWAADPQSAEAYLGAFILRNGTYGHLYNNVLASLLNKQGRSTRGLSLTRLTIWKLQHLWHRILPDHRFMAIQFPVLRRMPWLLPVCWMIRIIRSVVRISPLQQAEVNYLHQLTPAQIRFSIALQEKTRIYH